MRIALPSFPGPRQVVYAHLLLNASSTDARIHDEAAKWISFDGPDSFHAVAVRSGEILRIEGKIPEQLTGWRLEGHGGRAYSCQLIHQCIQRSDFVDWSELRVLSDKRTLDSTA